MTLPSLSTTLFLVCLPLLSDCTDPLNPRDELSEARRRWEAQKTKTYSYRLARSCECLPDFTRTADVMIVNGAVTRVRYVDDGTEVPAERVSRYPTVDSLFVTVERALDRNAARLAVDYHPQLGYPERIEVDYDAQGVDDELTVHASNLIPVTELRLTP